MEIFENDLTVQILPYSSLYKSANRKNYPTITCKFDLLKDIVNGADVGDLFLNYSAQLITNVLNEEKLDPNIYAKNDAVDDVVENNEEDDVVENIEENRNFLNDILFFGNADKAIGKITFI